MRIAAQKRDECIVSVAMSTVALLMFAALILMAKLGEDFRRRYMLLIISVSVMALFWLNQFLNWRHHRHVWLIGIGAADRSKEPGKYWSAVAILMFPLLVLLFVGIYLAIAGR